MSTTDQGKASGLQAQDNSQNVAVGEGNQSQVPSDDTGGAAIIGAPEIPPQVLVVKAEENLPAWFQPFWEHLSNKLLKQSAIIEKQLDEIKKLQRAHERACELMTHVKGYETGLSGVESKLDKIVRESEQATAHLQYVDTRLDMQNKDFMMMNQDLERALQELPQTHE